MNEYIESYKKKLIDILYHEAFDEISKMGILIRNAWADGKTIYLCGNGGSAGNAIHVANDFTYGVGKTSGVGIKVEALSSNAAVLTCLANDIGYESIYSEQIKVKGEKDDVLIVFSGSGNSPNVIKALEIANKLGMKTCAILGFSGGECKKLAQLPIHFPVNDMQIAEDLQLITCHICMQWLSDQNIQLKKDSK